MRVRNLMRCEIWLFDCASSSIACHTAIQLFPLHFAFSGRLLVTENVHKLKHHWQRERTLKADLKKEAGLELMTGCLMI